VIVTDSLAEELDAQVRVAGPPERAVAEKRYLKSELDFTGASLGSIRAIARELVRERGRLDHDAVVALVETLWSRPVFEPRMLAAVLLELHEPALSPADLPLLERLIRESRTWALVDWLAADVVGGIVLRHPDTQPTIDRWALDPDFWVRRSSLLAELRPLRGGAPLDRFEARAEAMLEEREFFIRKAIGWVLREAGKRRPAEVVAWLGPRTHRASGVTMREAVKYLPREDADRMMAAYRERRPAA